MGVVNVTPDSFSDGGTSFDTDTAVARGHQLIADGAQIVDVGGESTRPGSEGVPESEELGRVIPVIARLAASGVVVSVDTTKARVARAAVDAGAEIVNDVTAGGDGEMLEVMADTGVGVVLMHMQGTPRTMQLSPSYDDVVSEVASFLEERARRAQVAGVASGSIAIDPGIGFGKTTTHNLELIAGLGRLADLGHPVALGTSRKSFLGRLTGIEDPVARDGATATTTALGFERGARVFRVHDVASSRDALHIAAAIVSRAQWDERSLD
jgi:dihydropteroate synthase